MRIAGDAEEFNDAEETFEQEAGGQEPEAKEPAAQESAAQESAAHEPARACMFGSSWETSSRGLCERDARVC